MKTPIQLNKRPKNDVYGYDVKISAMAIIKYLQKELKTAEANGDDMQSLTLHNTLAVVSYFASVEKLKMQQWKKLSSKEKKQFIADTSNSYSPYL